MPKTKKKFIDKNNAVTFQLVHRSQHDPLVADESAPQHVLLPLDNKAGSSKRSKPKEEVKKQKEEQRQFGVFFDDHYNYLQHLKITDTAPAWEIIEDRYVIKKKDRSQANDKDKAPLNLPSSVFPSQFEEDVGMLNKAAPSSGPKIDWDPDIVAALDDAIDLDDPDNILEDDFFTQANCMGSNVEDDEGSDVRSDVAENMFMDSDDEFPDYYAEEETKSRFTEYSISSSVIHRNEGLKMLDNRFEKIFEEYDDEEIGALDDHEIEGYLNPDSQIFNAALSQYKKIKAEVNFKDVAKPCENFIDEDVINKEELIDINVDDTPNERWDCESILSTYSNLYNHPRLISEPRKIHPLKVSTRTGVPSEGLKSNKGLTSQKLKLLDSLGVDANTAGCASVAMSNASKASTFRPRNETTEDKKERKTNVKIERKERRMEKKANKLAFKDEEMRQKGVMMNLKNNMKAISLT